MELNKIMLNLPPSINIIAWLNKKNKKLIHVYLYSNNKKMEIFFNIEKNKIWFDKWSNAIIINRKDKNTKFLKLENFFYKFLRSWDVYFFSKIKFKGKGFRIKFLKKLRLVKFFFGKSHKSFIFFKRIILKKINKYKFILKNIKRDKLIYNANIATNIKPINFYTLRGLKKSRQIIFKRKGKKGTYI